jgi:hypothetical protein
MDHGGERPYPCPECAFTCKTKQQLNEHRRKHSVRKVIILFFSKQLVCSKKFGMFEKVWYVRNIDAHGLKILGRGYLMFFAKIPRGVKGFRKNCLGGSPYFGFIAFLLTSVLKVA